MVWVVYDYNTRMYDALNKNYTIATFDDYIKAYECANAVNARYNLLNSNHYNYYIQVNYVGDCRPEICIHLKKIVEAVNQKDLKKLSILSKNSCKENCEERLAVSAGYNRYTSIFIKPYPDGINYIE